METGMSTTMIIVLLAGVSFFAGIVLILAMGYVDTEEKRALEARTRQHESAERAAAIVALPRFFGPQPTLSTVVYDDGLVTRLEDYVRLEQTMVAQFVHHPSVDNLYRDPSSAPTHVH
jgi:hypothetical protein